MAFPMTFRDHDVAGFCDNIDPPPCGVREIVSRVRQMNQLWSFLSKKRNREILGWIGGGLVTVAVGLWAIFTYAFPSKQEVGSASTPNVQATGGGVAIGGNVKDATITTTTKGSAKP